MDNGDAPVRVYRPFAITAVPPYITYPVPVAAGAAGRASFDEGFPPINFVDPAVGGIPPFGADFNGLMRQATDGLRWLQAGGRNIYDVTFAGLIGGYPEGAIIASAVTPGLLWVCLADDNLSDPDAGGANWAPALIANVRRRLTANLDLYVSPGGSDANNGLTSLTPFATLQRAATLLQNGYDLSGFQVVVNCMPGTFSAGAQINGFVPGQTGPNSIVFLANTGSVTVNGVGFCFAANQGAMLSLDGDDFIVGATLSGGIGSPIVASGGGKVNINGVVNFAAAEGPHVLSTTGGQVSYSATEEISGGAPAHFQAHACGVITASAVGLAITGTPSFPNGFATADEGGIIEAQGYTVSSGSSTGPRYSAILGGVINTFGGGANVFPGDSAGSAPTGYYA